MVVATVGELRMEHKTKLGLLLIHGEEIAHPVEHGAMVANRGRTAGGRSTAAMPRCRTVVHRLLFEAQHLVGEGAGTGPVLAP